MLKINRKIEYALMAIKRLAKNQRSVIYGCTNAKDLCNEFHIPFDTVSKVLQQLQKAKIVKSQKGPKGGYRLIKSLEEISYNELLSALGEQDFSYYCNEHCDLSKFCNISNHLTRLNQEIESLLNSITLADLLSEDYSLRFFKEYKMLDNKQDRTIDLANSFSVINNEGTYE